jgi:hypothetical protein
MAENEVKHPPLPQVEHGVLLGFVCPRCFCFSPKYMASCGCYACTFCHFHVPPAAYAAGCELTALLVNHPSPQ